MLILIYLNNNSIKYKLSLTIHKAIHNSPDYLASLLHIHTSITTLQTRSSNTFILNTTLHFYKLHSSNIRSFALSAPYHWNSLPKHLRINSSTPSFTRHLKTHYFSLAFPPTQYFPSHGRRPSDGRLLTN